MGLTWKNGNLTGKLEFMVGRSMVIKENRLLSSSGTDLSSTIFNTFLIRV
jgi:hypothetical protein